MQEIVLDLPLVSSVSIFSTEESVITTHYTSEGEYQNYIILEGVKDPFGLYLSEKIAPTYEAFHDKLSAHKVFATQLVIYIPQNIIVSLKAYSCKVKINGDFNRVAIDVKEGKIDVNATYFKGIINTVTADVFLLGVQNKVFASTKKGQVKGPFEVEKNASLLISSRDGNISNISNRN